MWRGGREEGKGIPESPTLVARKLPSSEFGSDSSGGESGRNAVVCWERLAGPGPSLGGEGLPGQIISTKKCRGMEGAEVLGAQEVAVLPCNPRFTKGWKALAIS